MEGQRMTTFPWLTILTALPLVGALVVLALGGRNKSLVRWTALAFSLVSLLLTLILWHNFNSAADGFQFQELHAWIPSLNVDYRVGIDGLGLLMLLLTSIVVPIGMLASWQIEQRVPLYFALVLALQTCLFGTFTALNFFHWFIFWELAPDPRLLPGQTLGRLRQRQGRNAVPGLHHGRQRRDAAVVPRASSWPPRPSTSPNSRPSRRTAR